MIQVLDDRSITNETSEIFDALGGYTSTLGWARLVREQYGYETKWIVEGSLFSPDAFCALTFVDHPIFGKYAVTAPYSSYGGAWMQPSRPVSMEFVSAIDDLLKINSSSYANLRFLYAEPGITPPLNWVQQPIYHTYKVKLDPDLDQQINRYSSNHRNHVRKSLKKGFEMRIGNFGLLEDAYEGLARSMHELGSPYHKRSYLEDMLRCLADRVHFAVVYSGGSIVGAGVFIAQGDTIINLHANVLRDYRADHVGEFFYWSLIQHFTQQGYKTFDLGRSLEGSGNDIFKMKWAPEKMLLQYWYRMSKGSELPSLNQKNPKFALAIETWKRLPAFMVRSAGPYLINGLA